MADNMRLLRLDASARHDGSVSRLLGDELQARWLERHPAAEVRVRDLGEPLPQLDEAWVAASFTAPEARTAAQRQQLSLSDVLIDELQQADAVLLTVPLYNFGIPAALKAWIDLVCRARRTFVYSEEGPRGLLADRPVYLVMATGGVPVGSPQDFASAYLRHVLGFIGLKDVRMLAAEQLNLDYEAAMAKARAALDELFDTKEEEAVA